MPETQKRCRSYSLRQVSVLSWIIKRGPSMPFLVKLMNSWRALAASASETGILEDCTFPLSHSAEGSLHARPRRRLHYPVRSMEFHNKSAEMR